MAGPTEPNRWTIHVRHAHDAFREHWSGDRYWNAIVAYDKLALPVGAVKVLKLNGRLIHRVRITSLNAATATVTAEVTDHQYALDLPALDEGETVANDHSHLP